MNVNVDLSFLNDTAVRSAAARHKEEACVSNLFRARGALAIDSP